MAAPELVWWCEEGDDQRAAFHRATLEWVRSLGLEPDWLKPCAAVMRGVGGYELHVDEVVREPGGRLPRWDPLKPDEFLSVRRIVPVESGSWPAMPDREAAA